MDVPKVSFIQWFRCLFLPKLYFLTFFALLSSLDSSPPDTEAGSKWNAAQEPTEEAQNEATPSLPRLRPQPHPQHHPPATGTLSRVQDPL